MAARHIFSKTSKTFFRWGLLGWLLWMAQSVWAQDGAPALLPAQNLHQWGAVTLFHGLPSDHVRAIAQDSDGALWFGTDSGLAKYDGRRIQKIVADGLPANRVNVLMLDRRGTLWIGTDSGLARLVQGEFKALTETAGFAITDIVCGQDGQVAATGSKGTFFSIAVDSTGIPAVRSIGPKDNAFLKNDGADANPIGLTSLTWLENRFLLGTRSRGLLELSGSSVREIVSRPRAFFVRSVLAGPDGSLWFGAETGPDGNGLYESRDLLHPQKLPLATGTVSALCLDQRGRLWVGTTSAGVFCLEEGRERRHITFENSSGGLRSNTVHTVFTDREGVIWFGTDRGACRYDPQSPRVEAVSGDPESNFVRVLFRSSDERLWCGTNRGLFVRDPETAYWFEIEALRGKVIHSLTEDGSHRLLAGTANGLLAAELRSIGNAGQFLRLERSGEGLTANDSIRAMCDFQNVTYVASFGHGVERLEGTTRTLIWPGPQDDPKLRNVLSLHNDGNRKLWIGTAEAGVFSFDGTTVRPETSLPALSGSAIWDFEGKSPEGLWIATSRGLYTLQGDKLTATLDGNDVRALAPAETTDGVWCATAGNGVVKLVLNHPAGTVLTRLDTEHGLPSESVFSLLQYPLPNGTSQLWLGTNRGAVAYEPGRMAPGLVAARVFGHRLFGAEELRSRINLEYPQNSLVLDVTALSSRTFPEQFQYAFTLRTGQGSVIRQRISRDSQFLMENLRPGVYRIEAVAFTNDLTPSAPVSFEFSVAGAPFPWTTTALSVLLVFALVALWWGYQQNRKIARTNIALASANAQLAETRLLLAQETENERRRIARDLHDQTLADLRRLLLLSDQLPSGLSARDRDFITPSAFRTEIESISTEIRRICEDLSPSVLANIGITAALKWALSDAVAHLPPEERFECEFHCADDIEDRLRFDAGMEIQLYRIVQETLNNVCKHAAARKVSLRVDIVAAELVISIEDDGRGFDLLSQRVTSGRGLSNIRSRASLIDAEVIWENRPGGGTAFTLRKALA
ncbi:MAG: hypothetical protein K1Y36_13770 [Blastocatellia bacterium]|nr:hypothetical protein [Blastocatellia bacterium]